MARVETVKGDGTMAPPKMPPKPTAPKPPTQEQKANRSENARKGGNLFQAFQNGLLARLESCEVAAGDIGTAYAEAAEKYRSTIDDAYKLEAAETQILFSLLTIASSGALAWITTPVVVVEGAQFAARAAEAFASGVMQASVGEYFSADGPVVFPPETTQINDKTPTGFNNEMTKKVKLVRTKLYEFFAQRYLDLTADPGPEWDSFDFDDQAARLRKASKPILALAAEDNLRDIKYMRDQLELGMWAKYVLDHHSHREFPRAVMPPHHYDDVQDDYDNLPAPVYDRLVELGVASGPNWGGATTTAIVNRWAKFFKMPSFLFFDPNQIEIDPSGS
jgi:hypothetical protein